MHTDGQTLAKERFYFMLVLQGTHNNLTNFVNVNSKQQISDGICPITPENVTLYKSRFNINHCFCFLYHQHVETVFRIDVWKCYADSNISASRGSGCTVRIASKCYSTVFVTCFSALYSISLSGTCTHARTHTHTLQPHPLALLYPKHLFLLIRSLLPFWPWNQIRIEKPLVLARQSYVPTSCLITTRYELAFVSDNFTAKQSKSYPLTGRGRLCFQ
jgi:hypothetical protein